MQGQDAPPSSPSLESEPHWIRQQRKTFTAWCNHWLKEREMKLQRLEKDLTSGVALCHLLELLSGERLRGPSFHVNPRLKVHNLENLNISFSFLERKRIILVNIGPEDIYDGRTKLVLGLIWTLILRFQIQRGEWDEEKNSELNFPEGGGGPGGGGGGAMPKTSSVKHQLLDWCKQVLVPQGIEDITNFQQCWADGTFFCGLVNGLLPGTIDVQALDKSDARTNLELAFRKAEELCQIPILLDVEDMLEGKPDELSVMTYVSYFRQEHRTAKTQKPAASKTTASGDALESAYAGEECTIRVVAKMDDGSPCRKGGAKVLAYFVSDAGGRIDNPDLQVSTRDNSDGSYLVTFEVNKSGDYLLQVEMEGTPIQGSPFKLPVRAARADAAASVLVPPISADSEGAGGDTGLSPRVMLGSDGRARFTVQARDKFGHNHTQGGQKVVANLMIRCEVEDNGDGTYSISYVPSSDPHQQMFLDISLDGRQLGGSPYPVLMENKSKEVEEAMALLMKTQKEREEIEQNREELMRRIEDEKEKTSLYREAIIQLKENLEDEKKSKELMEEDKKAAQKKLELMKKKVKKEKVNARKSREKLNLEIDKLKDELKSEMMTRITVLTEKQEIEMKQAELQTVVGSLEKELSEERFARAQDEHELNAMKTMKEKLETELAEVTQKYTSGVNMLANFEEAQKGYEEQIALLKDSLEREEQCKRDLEDLQTRLGREMAERQMTQKQLQDELERARAEMAWQDRHKQQTEQERNELATRVRLLEDRVKEESTEKQKLEGVQYSLKRELSARRQSRALLQEEVEQLKFQLRVDAEELSAEQKTRLQLEQEMADLKRQLDKEASMKSDIEGQLAISSEVRQELEQRAERIRHSLQQIKTDYVNAEDKAKEMEQKLEDALKEKDDLSGLQKKLEGELRTRANSRASIRFEMDALRSQLAAFQEEEKEKEEKREKEMRMLREKLAREEKAREELEQLRRRLEEEMESERSNMIPSSSVEELEDAFNTAKNALETELSFKEEQLQLTKTKAEMEKEARLALEKELEALREKIRMTDIQTMSSLTRAQAKARERGDSRASMMLPPSAAAITASWSRANPGVGEKVYAPRKGDEIDAKLAEVANSKGLEVPFVWVKEGMYKFGGKNVNMRILNGYLVIRVGGGYMKFDEWYDKYGKKEGLKVNKDTLKDASASVEPGVRVGVHVRKGANVHTFLTADKGTTHAGED